MVFLWYFGSVLNNIYLTYLGTTFDIDIPFAYELPDSTTVVTARKLEDEHAAILEMVEDLLNK